MLAKGGNAVDAAVAASFTLSVVRPQSCGIGGGGFMVISLPGTATRPPVRTAINYREQAPAAAGPDYLALHADLNASKFGACAVAIPGTVAGLLYALERYGTLDRATVLAPAIAAAELGFIADEHYVASVKEASKSFADRPEYIERFHFTWERFLHRGKVKVGDPIVIPEQATALGLIARDGLTAFYTGPIAEAISRAVASDAGDLTIDDLAGTPGDGVRETAPMTFEYRGHTILTMPPPSSGGVALCEILGIVEASCSRRTLVERRAAEQWHEGCMDWLTIEGFSDESARRLHVLLEAMKHAFADRARWLADPAFVEVPTTHLTSAVYHRELAERIDSSRTLPSGSYGTPRQEGAHALQDAGTSHLSVIDAHGGAVACTETINLVFGSLLAVPEYGFILNNEMDDFLTRRGSANAFDLTQSDSNLPAPGKQPLSSMTPTIVLLGDEPAVVIGASGGPRIISAVAQGVLHALDGSVPMAWAGVGAARVHHQWIPDVVLVESGEFAFVGPTLVSARDDLQARGHVTETSGAIGNIQMIGRWLDAQRGWLMEAACDPRKGGRPAGIR